LIDDFLCRALRGEPAGWNALDGLPPDEFLDRCRHHGVSALLFHAVHQHESWAFWPLAVRQALEQASRAGVAQELLSTHYLKQLIEVFAERDIPCLLLKGEALASSLYPDAGTRTRSDSDLFIRIRDISAARQAVLDLGYEIVSPIYKSHQFTVMRPGDRTGNVRFDIHWRISNAPRFARILTFEEAYRDSIEAPGMAPVRMLSHVDALMLSCVHRFGSERHDRDRLIWIYDIHLLTTALADAQLMTFAQSAMERQVQAVCLDGLQRANDCFYCRLPIDVLGLLRSPACAKSRVRQLAESPVGLLLDDWRRLNGAQGRIGLMQELFLPSGQFLLDKYDKTNKLWLPVLYLRRLFGRHDRFSQK
jgi:hypothetical protein